jgi:hypothetical protein
MMRSFIIINPRHILKIKSNKTGWEGHIGPMEQMQNAYKFLIGKPEGKRPLGRKYIHKSMILKLILKMWDDKAWTRFIWLKIRANGGSL